MKEIPVEQAIGTVLAYDLTQIIPGEYNGAKFKKGHIYLIEKGDTDVHEDEAALGIA